MWDILFLRHSSALFLQNQVQNSSFPEYFSTATVSFAPKSVFAQKVCVCVRFVLGVFCVYADTMSMSAFVAIVF